MTSTYTPDISPQLGAVLLLGASGGENNAPINVGLRGTISKNYRLPTFNELYYSGQGGIGNPSLQPERATSAEGGMEASWQMFGGHHLSVTYFHSRIEDRIIWVPAAGLNYTPVNLRNVLSTGWEFAYKIQSLFSHIALDANYTSSSTEKMSAEFSGDPTVNAQLPNTPEDLGSITISYVERPQGFWCDAVTIFSTATYSSFRYLSEANSDFLPSYTQLNFGARAHASLGAYALTFGFELNNAFNANYQVLPGYPMPLRNIAVSTVLHCPL